MKKIFLLLLIWVLSSPSSHAWDKELYKNWEDAYLRSVDVSAQVKILSTDKPMLNSLKHKLFLPASCETIYEVHSVDSQPAGFGILPGDRFILKYRCNATGEYKGAVRAFPWIHSRANDFYEIKLRSSYLKKKRKHRWLILNQNKVFKPTP